MRLWHFRLLPYLPRQQLLSQWRECCCIAKIIEEKGTPNHVLVNRIMDYSVEHFQTYTNQVVAQMMKRGYKITTKSFWSYQRNVFMNCDRFNNGNKICSKNDLYNGNFIFYGWHDDIYLRECLYNMEEKARAGAIPTNEWRIICDKFKDFTPLWEGECND